MINVGSSSFKVGLFDPGGQETLAPKASGLDSCDLRWGEHPMARARFSALITMP